MKLNTSLVTAVVAFLLLSPGRGFAQERLCDTAFEDCRTPLWALIDAETAGIDVAFWFMDDTSYVTKLVNKFKSGVPVRVLVDPRANASHPINTQVLNDLAAAGIPIRKNVAPGGVLHWKMMLFVGQNIVQFSAANYGPENFVPTTPFSNYIDEVIYFSNTSSIVNSFKTKYDDKWIDTTRFANYANVSGPLTRKYPIFPKDPQLNYPPEESFANRAAAEYNQETQKIDLTLFRNTDERHTDAFISALNRGVPLRILTEPETYRSTTFFKHAYNLDRMYMAGALIKNRKHLGLTHEKLTLLYGRGMAIFGSSNLTIPSSDSQDEHNLFTRDPVKFQWFADQFQRKWNSPTEFEQFVPLPPDVPNSPSPANNALITPTNVTLSWEGGFWAWKYDIYFGTTSNPPLIASDVSTGFPGPPTTETLALSPLQPGTTYFWRIVGKTVANKTASGPIWSFVTAGTPAPTPTPTPTPTGSAPVLAANAANRGIVLHSPSFVKEPFTVTSNLNLSSDTRTRLLLFATKMGPVTAETLSQTTAVAVNAQGTRFPLPVEYVGALSGADGFTALIVRLPSDLSTGDVAISITLNGAQSNSVMVAIKPP